VRALLGILLPWLILRRTESTPVAAASLQQAPAGSSRCSRCMFVSRSSSSSSSSSAKCPAAWDGLHVCQLMRQSFTTIMYSARCTAPGTAGAQQQLHSLQATAWINSLLPRLCCAALLHNSAAASPFCGPAAWRHAMKPHKAIFPDFVPPKLLHCR
jgi:hypothetical protein